MKNEIISEYVEKVFAFSLKRTYSYDEAEELSQEILTTALKELPKLKNEQSFEFWFWGLANNVTKTFSRKMGKQRAMFTYDVPENFTYEDDTDTVDEELYSSLRRSVAMLSKTYRDIIVLHYYDNLSVKQISERLCIPEGTVTWRLSEARRKLTKECNEMNETALRPKTMHINIHGSGNYNGTTIPFPTVYIDDALSQNILCYCYEEAHSIEELSKYCGVPAYYIEDRVDNLVKRNAVIEQTKGKYRTDFVVWSDKYGIYLEENAEKALLPMMDKIFDALKKIAEEAKNINFYRGGKNEDDLFYLYGVQAFNYLRSAYCKMPRVEIKPKYDGYRWSYIGSIETGAHPRIGITVNCCGNYGTNGGYSHDVYCHFGNINFRPMMTDNLINACVDIVLHGATEDTESAAEAIQKGYIKRDENGSLAVTVPLFKKEQSDEFFALTEKYLFPLGEEYAQCVDSLLAGYKKLFPKHLQDEADFFTRHLFFSLFAVLIKYWQRTGVVKMPSEDFHCDVLLNFK